MSLGVKVRGDRRPPPGLPPGWRWPGLRTVGAVVVVGGFLVHGYSAGARIAPGSLIDGAGRFAEFAGRAFPPDVERVASILSALLVTFEMALLGTIVGVLCSLPLALAAARSTTPNRLCYACARGFIGLCRTVPDLVWGLIFVSRVTPSRAAVVPYRLRTSSTTTPTA